MAGGVTSPPIIRAAFRIEVPGSTSMVMLSIVTLKSFFSSAIILLRCYLKRPGIICQPVISFQTVLTVQFMPFIFVAEVRDVGGYRPCGGIAQPTDGVTFYLALYIP